MDDFGLAGRRDLVVPMVLDAWDTFLDLASAADLDRRSRLAGWRGQEICVHLGAWDDHQAVRELVASARQGGHGDPADVDAVNARVTAAHRDAGRDEVLAALRRNRDAVAAYAAEQPESLDTRPTVSTVGRLPMLSVLLGQAYELAVHALDLVSCGAPEPPWSLLCAGLAALADVTGALAAECGIEGAATLQTPDGGWSFAASPDGWSVTDVAAGAGGDTVIAGAAGVLLDASAGRNNPVVQLARRRLKVRGLGGLLRLAPIVEAAPGLPGGPLLRVAARTLSRAG